MHLENGRPTVRNAHTVASCCPNVITVAKQDIGILIACHHLLEVFPCLEEICTERWEEEVDTLV